MAKMNGFVNEGRTSVCFFAAELLESRHSSSNKDLLFHCHQESVDNYKERLALLRLHQLAGGSTGPGYILLCFHLKENIFN